MKKEKTREQIRRATRNKALAARARYAREYSYREEYRRMYRDGFAEGVELVLDILLPPARNHQGEGR